MKYKKRKNGVKRANVLKCMIPGLMRDMELVFPGRKLPVCEKCKKIYKTRQLCRERDGHTAFPWNKTYICFVVDESCFVTDAMGNQCIVREDGPNPYNFYAENITCSNTKYVAKLDSKGQLDPICTPCKLKNYTKSHCRKKHGHKFLPWSTVYMKLSAKPSQAEVVQMRSKREALCLPTGNIPNSVEPSKKIKIDENSKVHALSNNAYVNVPHSNLFSADRNNSKAFLLILSDKKCELEVR